MKRMFLNLTMCLLLAATSCKKDKDKGNEDVTPTIATVSGTYRTTAATRDNENIFNNSDVSKNYYEPCQRDNEYKLTSNMAMQIVDAGTVCGFTAGGNGTWSLSGNTISFDGDPSVFDTGDFTITSFNGKKLVITQTRAGRVFVYTYEKI